MAVVALVVLVASACGGSTDESDGTEVGSDTTEEATEASTEADTETADTETADTESADEPADSDDAAATSSDGSSDADGGDAASTDGDADSGTVEITEEMSAAEIVELLFPSFDEDSLADQQAQWEDQERERQQLIVECMAEQGFEYIAVDYSDQVSFGGFDEGLDPTSREWAELYGFGWTTFTGNEEAVEGGEEEWVDPNWQYVEGLSEGAQEAYYAALYGTPPEFDPNLSDEEFDQLLEENPDLFAPQGCDGEAWEATNEFAQLDNVWMALGDEFDELYERVEADPRVAGFEREWAECMAGKGHAYADMDELYEDLSRRSEELWNFDDYVDPTAGMTEEEIQSFIDSSTQEELDEFFAPPEVDPELQAEIQQWEIALALDSFDCGGTSQWELFDEVLQELQAQFVDENLDAIQAALAQNG